MMTMLLDDKLHLAPIPKDVGKVLDIGCGTGIWAMYDGARFSLSLFSSPSPPTMESIDDSG